MRKYTVSEDPEPSRSPTRDGRGEPSRGFDVYRCSWPYRRWELVRVLAENGRSGGAEAEGDDRRMRLALLILKFAV